GEKDATRNQFNLGMRGRDLRQREIVVRQLADRVRELAQRARHEHLSAEADGQCSERSHRRSPSPPYSSACVTLMTCWNEQTSECGPTCTRGGAGFVAVIPGSTISMRTDSMNSTEGIRWRSP